MYFGAYRGVSTPLELFALLLRREGPIHSERILAVRRGSEADNALRQDVHRLRKRLAQAGFPGAVVNDHGRGYSVVLFGSGQRTAA